MPRRIIFDPEARLEFEDAVEWYNAEEAGAGDRLETEVHETLQRILQGPERYRLVGRTTRIARLRTFYRYSIYFHVESEFIGVISVFHASRNPKDIKRRIT